MGSGGVSAGTGDGARGWRAVGARLIKYSKMHLCSNVLSTLGEQGEGVLCSWGTWPTSQSFWSQGLPLVLLSLGTPFLPVSWFLHISYSCSLAQLASLFLLNLLHWRWSLIHFFFHVLNPRCPQVTIIIIATLDTTVPKRINEKKIGVFPDQGSCCYEEVTRRGRWTRSGQ